MFWRERGRERENLNWYMLIIWLNNWLFSKGDGIGIVSSILGFIC